MLKKICLQELKISFGQQKHAPLEKGLDLLDATFLKCCLFYFAKIFSKSTRVLKKNVTYSSNILIKLVNITDFTLRKKKNALQYSSQFSG